MNKYVIIRFYKDPLKENEDFSYLIPDDYNKLEIIKP